MGGVEGGFLLVFVLSDMKRQFLTPDLSDIIYTVELNCVSIKSFPMAELAVHFLVNLIFFQLILFF